MELSIVAPFILLPRYAAERGRRLFVYILAPSGYCMLTFVFTTEGVLRDSITLIYLKQRRKGTTYHAGCDGEGIYWEEHKS